MTCYAGVSLYATRAYQLHACTLEGLTEAVSYKLYNMLTNANLRDYGLSIYHVVLLFTVHLLIANAEIPSTVFEYFP